VQSGEPTTGPFGIEIDGAGHVWTTENYQDRLARLDPATGKVERFPLTQGFDGPTDMLKDRKGLLWISAHAANRVARVDPATGEVQEFFTQPPDPGVAALTLPFGLVEAVNGHLWFAEHEGNRIGRLIPETETVVEYPLPGPDTWAQWIALDLDGNLWYAGYNNHTVGRIGGDVPYVTFESRDHRVALREGDTYRGALTVRAYGGPVSLDLSSMTPGDPSSPEEYQASARVRAAFSPAMVDLAPGESREVSFTLQAQAGKAPTEGTVLLAGRGPQLLASTALRVSVLPPSPFSAAWFSRYGRGIAGGAGMAALLALVGWYGWHLRSKRR
jgi:DNA-binding beta-propeller fold protein YncE